MRDDIEEPTDLEKKLKSVPPAAVAVDAIAGAAAGATVGVLAGPPGIVAGAVIGGAIGSAAAAALHIGHLYEQRKEEELDRDIGVIGGDIGEASPNAPKPKLGAFHTSSMGMGTDVGPVPNEGPMQNVEGD